MGAGAEGAAGVDDEVDRALARLLPGGAQPEALADQERLVEVLPAIGPVVGDLGRDHLDQAVARRDLDLAQLRQLALAAVDRVLDVAGPALLLDPVRAPARSARRGPARPARAAADREADQPNARRMRQKKPSPSPCRSAGCRGSSDLPELLGQLALLVGELLRDDHVHDDRQVAGRRPPLAPGMPCAAQRELGCPAGCRRQLDLALALVARRCDRRARASPRSRSPRGTLHQVRPLAVEAVVGAYARPET